MADEHPIFPPPENRHCRIWRYMDFTKYVWLLQNRALYFSRVDLLEDRFEGSYSRANQELRPSVYKEVLKDATPGWLDQLSEGNRHQAKWILVNCWHQNDHESAAMWKLYGRASEAVAIQSTYQRLFDCLPAQTYVGCVKYIDYEHEWLPEGNAFSPFMHKRKFFEDEREIRAVIQGLPEPRTGFRFSQPNTEIGRSIPIDLDALIEGVYVSPASPKWYYQLVGDVSSRFDCAIPVSQSSLDASPVY